MVINQGLPAILMSPKSRIPFGNYYCHILMLLHLSHTTESWLSFNIVSSFPTLLWLWLRFRMLHQQHGSWHSQQWDLSPKFYFPLYTHLFMTPSWLPNWEVASMAILAVFHRDICLPNAFTDTVQSILHILFINTDLTHSFERVLDCTLRSRIGGFLGKC